MPLVFELAMNQIIRKLCNVFGKLLLEHVEIRLLLPLVKHALIQLLLLVLFLLKSEIRFVHSVLVINLVLLVISITISLLDDGSFLG